LALPAPGSPSSTAGAPATPIDLNTATGDQLESLPGVGPVLAQRILDWRTAHGGFGSVDELTEVSGIGEATLADLRTLVRV
jgi:competence protein ComEA